MANIIVGVTGSIAAYKACDIVSGLVKEKHTVQVVMTQESLKFITPLSLQTLSKNRVYCDVMQEDDPTEVKHITLSDEADLLVIAPASGNTINKIGAGLADDMLSCIAFAMWEKPFVVAPAMNTRMFCNPMTQQNIEKLRQSGHWIVDPKESLLACGDIGKGALANIPDILKAINSALNRRC